MYVTQGTVRVELDEKETKVFITPAENYAIKYKGKDYTLFIKDVNDTKLCDTSNVEFTAINSLRHALVQAAIEGTKVEISVVSLKKKPKITGIKIPATPHS